MSIPIVKFVRIYHDSEIPAKQTAQAACYDVFSYLPQGYTLKPQERFAIPTGIILEIPDGYFVSVRPRSGLALREGLSLPNSPGTIDADFRGELKILVMNLSSTDITLSHKQRIAQMLLEKSIKFDLQETTLSNLSNTARGAQGFGSTGKR